MTNNITVNEKQLGQFFGIEGVPLDKNMSWPYNDYLYEINKNGFEMSFSIHPAMKDIRILLVKGKLKIFESNRMDVTDVSVVTNGNERSLIIHHSKDHYLSLKLEPNIQIDDYVGTLQSN